MREISDFGIWVMKYSNHCLSFRYQHSFFISIQRDYFQILSNMHLEMFHWKWIFPLNFSAFRHIPCRKKGHLTKEDCEARLRWARRIQAQVLSEDFWTHRIGFYFDGAHFLHMFAFIWVCQDPTNKNTEKEKWSLQSPWFSQGVVVGP